MHFNWLNKHATEEFVDLVKNGGAYPKIEKPFSEITEMPRYENIRLKAGLLAVSGPDGKSYTADEWIFLWVVDFKERFFQFLINRSPQEGGKGIIAAAAPMDLVEFLKNIPNAMVATLSLINDPEKIKGAMLLVTRPPSYKEKVETEQKMQTLNRFKNWVDVMKATPNVEGQWFPTFAPRCPICNQEMKELEGYNIAFGQIICETCGYKMKKGK